MIGRGSAVGYPTWTLGLGIRRSFIVSTFLTAGVTKPLGVATATLRSTKSR
jgi:hypothetical protein